MSDPLSHRDDAGECFDCEEPATEASHPWCDACLAKQQRDYAIEHGVESDRRSDARIVTLEATLARVRAWRQINERILDDRMILRDLDRALVGEEEPHAR